MPRGQSRSTRNRVPSVRETESYARFNAIIGASGLIYAAHPRTSSSSVLRYRLTCTSGTIKTGRWDRRLARIAVEPGVAGANQSSGSHPTR
jgi:hypothetical protein